MIFIFLLRDITFRRAKVLFLLCLVLNLNLFLPLFENPLDFWIIFQFIQFLFCWVLSDINNWDSFQPFLSSSFSFFLCWKLLFTLEPIILQLLMALLFNFLSSFLLIVDFLLFLILIIFAHLFILFDSNEILIFVFLKLAIGKLILRFFP